MTPATISTETWSVAQTSEHTGLSETSIRRAIASGELRAYKFGRRILIKPADVERAMKPIKTYTPSAKAGEELD